jgi:hypothetical protein
MKGTEYFVLLYIYMNVVVTEDHNVMIDSRVLKGTKEYLTL